MTKEQKIELVEKRIQMIQVLRDNEYRFMRESSRTPWDTNADRFSEMLKAEVTKLEQVLAMPDEAKVDDGEEHA
jgi:hypothetical protein